MARKHWIIAAATALGGFYVGKSLGPAPVVFADPSSARSAEEMEAEVAKALAEPRAFVRASALIRLGEGLSIENVEGLVRAVRSNAADNDPVDLQILLTAWTHLDPEAAMREVQSWPIRSRRETGMRVVMREWAATGKTLEAGNYYDTLTDPEQRTLMASPLVRGWALSGDAKGALGLAQRFFDSEEHRDTVEALVRGLIHAEGAEAVFALARSLDPQTGGKFPRRLARTTLDLAGREDPVAASRYYDELVAAGPTSPWLDGSLAAIAGLLRNETPEAAIAWLGPKGESPERNRALTETMAAWAKRDLDAAWSAFEAGHGDAIADPARALTATESAQLAGILQRMARVRPEQAAPLALRLRTRSERIEALRRVAYFWSMKAPAEVDRWLTSLDLDGPDRARVDEAARWGRSETSDAAQRVDD